VPNTVNQLSSREPNDIYSLEYPNKKCSIVYTPIFQLAGQI